MLSLTDGSITVVFRDVVDIGGWQGAQGSMVLLLACLHLKVWENVDCVPQLSVYFADSSIPPIEF